MNKKSKNGIEEKEYSLIVEMGDADFTESNRPGDLPKKKTVYTAGVAEKNRLVETLDRYDDFSQLQIPPKSYEKRGVYGIKRTATHAGDEIILEHQRKAAQKFLKELRGFGLLADIVGSGKTYEACVVLSELAARGKINSLLLIVPEQVFGKWVDVLEMQFGLGKGVLYQADATLSERGADDKNKKSFDDNVDALTERNSAGFIIVKRPIIVSTEDFVKWPESICDVLFDAVVVDEAHHLCAEEGQYSHAMYRLSKLMQVKKRANKTYCILCSATPHSGDIEHMFRLWYFIRCNGGTPSDFEEKDDSRRTLKYRTEKEFYKTRVCHNASTVMEFIKKVKVEKTEYDYGGELKSYIEGRLVGDDRDRRLLELYLSELNGGNCGLTDSEKFGVVADFLERNVEINELVSDYVANEYHNGVLRSIMIRQANRVGKKRNVMNIMFAPVRNIPATMDIIVPNRREKATIKVAEMNDAGCVDFDGEKLSVFEYAGRFAPDKSFRVQMRTYADIMLNGESGILPRMGMDNGLLGDGPIPHGEGISYYLRQTASLGKNDSVQMRFIPVVFDKIDILTMKIAALKKIVRENADKRIIVFFDYELRKNGAVYDAVEDALNADPAIKGRILIGRSTNKERAVKTFEETQDTVLIVEDAAFTEGVDMQECNIIVNFQIPPDPVAMDQRIGRIFRLGQKNDIYIYSLADMRALEGYVLMYFSRIGLLSSNSGDATIIAGCNNERSVTVRCKGCGKARMYDEEEYNRKSKADSDELYCRDTDACIAENPTRGTRMEIIGTYDFKCDNCGEVISRSEDGYLCMSINSTGKRVMCNGGESNDRNIYCHKICAIAHCRKFTEGAFKDKCPALKLYRSNPNVSEAQLLAACEMCAHKCPPECRVAYGDAIGPELISRCSDCPEALCSPAPHNLAFNEKWECRCPSCRQGTLKPIRAHTFAEYVRSLWNYRFDGNEFSRRLSDEATKVASIKSILDKDK